MTDDKPFDWANATAAEIQAEFLRRPADRSDVVRNLDAREQAHLDACERARQQPGIADLVTELRKLVDVTGLVADELKRLRQALDRKADKEDDR